jgi:hypothetical protein
MLAGPPEAPTAAICARIESPRRAGQGGWLHVLRHDDGPTWPRWRRTIPAATVGTSPARKIDFGRLAADFRAAVKPAALVALADGLGVSTTSLTRLRIGWSIRSSAWSFPMTDAAGNVPGIRLRRPDGRKFSVRGGHEGLFVPTKIDGRDRLLVCEGPTDTAALLDLGFAAVGRPSCTGGVKHLVELVGRPTPPELVIVADADPPGQRGSHNLAATLLAYVPTVRVITPAAPYKDVRQWVQAGATADDVLATIVAAPIWRLGIKSTVHSRR